MSTNYINYELTEAQKKRLENNFKYHPPQDDQPVKYEIIRTEAKKFAELLMTLCPDSRELSVALTDLEGVVMWANASIARNEESISSILSTPPDEEE